MPYQPNVLLLHLALFGFNQNWPGWCSTETLNWDMLVNTPTKDRWQWEALPITSRIPIILKPRLNKMIYIHVLWQWNQRLLLKRINHLWPAEEDYWCKWNVSKEMSQAFHDEISLNARSHLQKMRHLNKRFIVLLQASMRGCSAVYMPTTLIL